MSMTTKGDGSYEAPWFVLPDDPNVLRTGPEDLNDLPLEELQRLYLIRAFALVPANVEGLSLVDTFMHCAYIWRERAGLTNGGVQIVAGGEPAAGAAPVQEEKPAAKPRAARKPKATKSAAEAAPEAPAEPEAPQHEYQAVLDQVDKAESAADIRSIFLDNKDAFEDATVAEAASAKRKTFS